VENLANKQQNKNERMVLIKRWPTFCLLILGVHSHKFDAICVTLFEEKVPNRTGNNEVKLCDLYGREY